MKTPGTVAAGETQGQLRGLAGALRGLARCLGAIPVGPGVEAMVLKGILDRARQGLLSTAWRLERRAAGLPSLPERGEVDAREAGWPPVRFAPDFNTSGAMKAELRAYGAVLREITSALRDLEAGVGSRSLLVEEEPRPELGKAVVDAVAGLEVAARACR